MASMDRAEPRPTPAPAPDATPAPETPDRPHGDPLAPEVPTDPPAQPADDPTVGHASPLARDGEPALG